MHFHQREPLPPPHPLLSHPLPRNTHTHTHANLPESVEARLFNGGHMELLTSSICGSKSPGRDAPFGAAEGNFHCQNLPTGLGCQWTLAVTQGIPAVLGPGQG